MREYGLTILVAAAVTYLLTPLVRRFAIAVGAKHAARARDVHTDPVPLLGGIAMYLGLAAGLMVASRLTHLSTVFMGTRVGSGLLLAGGLVVLMGFVDDRWGLGAITKLAGQVGAGAILVWSGAVVAWLPVPGGGTLSLTPDQQTVLTILLVVVTINAVNFIDGLDGLAAGIVGIGAAAFFLYYYTLTKRLGLDEQTNPALASAILAGVCLGFLPHNFHPARIFMGDTGSMLLGLLLAYAPISSLASLDPNTLTNPSAYSGGTVNRFPEILPLLVPAIIMLIPYADLLLAVVRRTRAGQSPFSADKKHLQHRLLAIGHSHRASVLIMYLWASLFAGTVVLLSIMRTKLLILGIVTLAGVLVLLLASMPRLRPWNRRGQFRLATDMAGPVPSAGIPPGGRPGSPMAAPVPAAAGISAPARGPADHGGSLDRGLNVDRGTGVAPGFGADPDLGAGRGTGPEGGLGPDRRLGVDRRAGRDPGASLDRGLGADRELGPDRRLGADRRAGGDPGASLDRGLGHGPASRPPGRPGATYADTWRGDPGRGDAGNGSAWSGNDGRRDAGYGGARYADPGNGAGNPGQGRAGPRWDARSVPAGRDGRPAGQQEPGPWYPGRADPGRADAGQPDPGRAEAGREDAGHPDPGQWYPGRPGPGQRDSGPWDARPDDPGLHDAASRDDSLGDDSLGDGGRRDAGSPDSHARDASFYAAPPPSGAGPYDAGPHDVRPPHDVGQDLDPLAPDAMRARPSAPPRTNPANRDRDSHDGDDDQSPLTPWRFH